MEINKKSKIIFLFLFSLFFFQSSGNAGVFSFLGRHSGKIALASLASGVVLSSADAYMTFVAIKKLEEEIDSMPEGSIEQKQYKYEAEEQLKKYKKGLNWIRGAEVVAWLSALAFGIKAIRNRNGEGEPSREGGNQEISPRGVGPKLDEKVGKENLKKIFGEEFSEDILYENSSGKVVGAHQVYFKKTERKNKNYDYKLYARTLDNAKAIYFRINGEKQKVLNLIKDFEKGIEGEIKRIEDNGGEGTIEDSKLTRAYDIARMAHSIGLYCQVEGRHDATTEGG